MLKNFISQQDLVQVLDRPNVLAALHCAPEINATHSAELDLPSTLLELLDSSAATEVWEIDDELVSHGVEGECHWRRSNSLQFSSVSQADTTGENLEKATYQCYSALLKFIKSSPHPELVRFWNYVPNINHGAGDAENYKRFCTGRLRAFSEQGFNDSDFPAASAVGHYQQGLTVCAFSAARSTTHHANPRQVDAFKYPREYGPSSPSFARASTIELNDNRLCFISGTASILGHSSVHRGDLRLQLYTTNDNILYLLKETGFKRQHIQTLRVYLRHQEDEQQCKQIVQELFLDATIILLHADICRSDLLMEIECFCVAD